MGQYYVLANPVKREFLRPLTFGQATKLTNYFGQFGAMMGLAILIADGNGNGDWDAEDKPAIYGSWAGDPVVLAGDYGTRGRFLSEEEKRQYATRNGRGEWMDPTLCSVARDHYRDVSEDVLCAIIATEDEHIVRLLQKELGPQATPNVREAFHRRSVSPLVPRKNATFWV